LLRQLRRPHVLGPVVRVYSIATVDAHAKPMRHHKSVIVLFQIVLRLLIDLIALTAVASRQRRATAAVILVLRRQTAFYKERGIKPRRIDPVTPISLALLSRFFKLRIQVSPRTPARRPKTASLAWGPRRGASSFGGEFFFNPVRYLHRECEGYTAHRFNQ
jgi:hypothetical protein